MGLLAEKFFLPMSGETLLAQIESTLSIFLLALSTSIM
jgi:hypothetical protein